jgi:sensor c-di-GMP phosphodiesterase-like protein
MSRETRNVAEFQRDAIRVTVAFTGVRLLLRFLEPLFVASSDKEHDIATMLVQEANRYYETSVQDRNAHLRYQHAHSAHVHLETARKMVRDRELERLTRFNIHDLQTSIQKQEKSSQREMMKQCPKLKVSHMTTNDPPTVTPSAQRKLTHWP